MSLKIELSPQEHQLLILIGAFFNKYPNRLAAAAARLEARINERGVRGHLERQAEDAASGYERDAESWPDMAKEFKSRARRVRQEAKNSEFWPHRQPYWRYAATALLALCIDPAPPTRMTEEQACDILFLLWSPWDNSVDLARVGCPSGAARKNEEGWGREYVFNEILRRCRERELPRNGQGLLPPFERARRALAEVTEEDSREDEYRPATWFKKGAASRLRMASAPGRKSKRVRHKIIDGVKCYCVADARLWFPKDIPKSPQ